jgi:SAM-dependent methyltransferase
MTSYSSRHTTLRNRLQEGLYLYMRHRDEMAKGARSVVDKSNEIAAMIEKHTGLVPRSKQLLDVGCGQQLKHAKYFALCENDVTAIDADVIPGLNPLAYWRLYRANGFVRLGKTLTRKALGIDRRFDRELARRFQAQPRPIDARQMDATALQFEANTFDMVYSVSVFEHLPDPERVTREIRRVLKPGGAIYLGAHLYTSESGSHDPRILSGQRAGIPLWPHLRPAHAATVRANSYLNKWRLDDYIAMFQAVFPQAQILRFRRGEPRLKQDLDALRAQGELTEYRDEELLVDEVAVVWTKPTEADAND